MSPLTVNLATLSDTLPVPVQAPGGVGYGAIDLRRLNAADIQEGVVAAGDFKVTQRAAGAGAGVDVAAGQLFVNGDSVAREGLYYAGASSPFTGATQVDVPNSDPTNPRVDQLVLEVKNDAHDGSGLNLARLRVVTGTPSPGTQTSNPAGANYRLGAAALPNTAIRLAEWATPAGGGAPVITNALIADRRQWARGGFRSFQDATTRTTSTAVTAHPVFTSVLECSGVPMRLAYDANLQHSVAAGFGLATVLVDGVASGGFSNFVREQLPAAAQPLHLAFTFPFTPPAGRHTIALAWGTNMATLTQSPVAGSDAATCIIEEIVRQNADNT